MRRRNLPWAAALGLATGILGLAAWAASGLNPARERSLVEAAVQQATGRALSIRGTLRVHWSLWPVLDVSDVRLANLPGGSRPDMARAERIEAQLSLPALLLHRIEVTHLALTGPNILFEQVGGAANWVFKRDGGTTGTPATGGHPRFALEFQDAAVRNGMVTFHFPARTNVIGIRTLHLRAPVANGPLDLSTVLVYSDNAPFNLSATATPTGRVSDPWNTILHLSAFGTDAVATGSMTLDSHYDLQVKADSPALEKLNALLPEMKLPALHGMHLAVRLRNGPQRGDLPRIGPLRLAVDRADLSDRLPGLSLQQLNVVLPNTAATATASATMRFRTRQIGLDGTVAVPDPLDGAASSAFRLTLTADAADTLNLDGRLKLRSAAFDGLDAALSLHAADLASLQPTPLPLPRLNDLSVDARLRLPADLRDATLSGIDGRAREGDLSGTLALALRPPGGLSGRLRSKRLDLDALLPASAAPAGPAAAVPPSGGTLIPRKPLPWPSLRKAPSLDLAWHVDTARIRGQSWTPLSLSLTLDGGQLHLLTPEGPVQGGLSVDARSDDASVALSMQADQLPLPLLFGMAGFADAASGSVQLAVSMRGHGRDAHALAASLAGRASLSVRNGSLDDAVLIRLAGPALKQLRVSVPAEGKAPIRCLLVDMTAQDGVLQMPVFALDTGYLVLDGAGTLDLRTEQLAMKLHPMAHLAGSRVSVPVLVEGPMGAPTSRVDAGGLDKVGLLIDALFGGDHPHTCAVASRGGR